MVGLNRVRSRGFGRPRLQRRETRDMAAESSTSSTVRSRTELPKTDWFRDSASSWSRCCCSLFTCPHACRALLLPHEARDTLRELLYFSEYYTE